MRTRSKILLVATAVALSSAAVAASSVPSVKGHKNVDLSGVEWFYAKIETDQGAVMARCRILEGGKGHCEGRAVK